MWSIKMCNLFYVDCRVIATDAKYTHAHDKKTSKIGFPKWNEISVQKNTIICLGLRARYDPFLWSKEGQTLTKLDFAHKIGTVCWLLNDEAKKNVSAKCTQILSWHQQKNK